MASVDCHSSLLQHPDDTVFPLYRGENWGFKCVSFAQVTKLVYSSLSSVKPLVYSSKNIYRKSSICHDLGEVGKWTAKAIIYCICYNLDGSEFVRRSEEEHLIQSWVEQMSENIFLWSQCWSWVWKKKWVFLEDFKNSNYHSMVRGAVMVEQIRLKHVLKERDH